MSATLVVRNPQLPVAYAIADTRLTLPGGNYSDEGTHEITFPDGSTFQVDALGRKLRRFGSFWLAASGHFYFVLSCFERLRNDAPSGVEAAKAIVNSTLESAKAVAAELGEDPSTIAANFSFVASCIDSFAIDYFVVGKDQPDLGEAQFCLSTPPELPPGLSQAISGRINQHLNLGDTNSAHCDNIRLFAKVFHDIHLNGASVSDRIEFVVLRVADGRIRARGGCASNLALLNSPCSDIRGLMAPR